jgi:hypothetical protein
MPPKPIPTPSANNASTLLPTDGPTKNFSIALVISKKNEEAASVPVSPRALTSGIRLRTFSSWGDSCLTTPLFGSESLPWVKNEENQTNEVKIQFQFDTECADNDQLRAFHSDPGIYFLFSHVNETTIKPVDFLHIDCSFSLIRAHKFTLSRTIYNDSYQVEITVTNSKPIRSLQGLVPLEPMVFSIKL